MNQSENQQTGQLRTAFEEEYRNTVDKIYAYISKRVNSADLALDITQKVYLRAFERFHLYKKTDKPYIALLYTIASSMLVDEWRKSSKQKVQEVQEDIASQGDVTAETDSALARQTLSPYLSKLSEDFRLVLELRYFAELDPSEIAVLTGWSKDKVGVIHHRALRRLASLMS